MTNRETRIPNTWYLLARCTTSKCVCFTYNTSL